MAPDLDGEYGAGQRRVEGGGNRGRSSTGNERAPVAIRQAEALTQETATGGTQMNARPLAVDGMAGDDGGGSEKELHQGIPDGQPPASRAAQIGQDVQDAHLPHRWLQALENPPEDQCSGHRQQEPGQGLQVFVIADFTTGQEPNLPDFDKPAECQHRYPRQQPGNCAVKGYADEFRPSHGSRWGGWGS
jgi:hypothetical protein